VEGGRLCTQAEGSGGGQQEYNLDARWGQFYVIARWRSRTGGRPRECREGVEQYQDSSKTGVSDGHHTRSKARCHALFAFSFRGLPSPHLKKQRPLSGKVGILPQPAAAARLLLINSYATLYLRLLPHHASAGLEHCRSELSISCKVTPPSAQRPASRQQATLVS
jgi:hypothetical protein